MTRRLAVFTAGFSAGLIAAGVLVITGLKRLRRMVGV